MGWMMGRCWKRRFGGLRVEEGGHGGLGGGQSFLGVVDMDVYCIGFGSLTSRGELKTGWKIVAINGVFW